MKRTRTFLTAALGLTLAACNVESDLLPWQKDLYTETITVTANRDDVDVNGQDGTRAVLTEDNTLKSVWEAGDQLTVWTGETYNADNMSERGFTLDSGAGTNSCTFTGKLKSTSKPNKNTQLTAVVDNSGDAVDCSTGDKATLDISEQAGCTVNDVLHYDALWAQASYGKRDFHFQHTMSFVEWTIAIPGITEATTCDITLSATGLQNKASLNLSTGVLTGTNEGDIKLTGVSINPTDGESNVIYVALCPGAVTSTMTAVVTLADGRVTTGQLGTFEEFTFVANNLYTAAWTFGAPAAPTYTFTATSPAAIAYNATTTDNYTVTSYATVGSTQQPVAWEVTKYEYSDDGGTTWTDGQPAWFTSLSSTSGSGSTSGENGTATVSAADIVTDNPVNSILKNATPKNGYDLSQGGETANCYVISAPGTYKIPLIYGNARNASGTENTACFNNTSPYVNYKGTAITNMWLKTDGTPSTGSLVWKDVTTDIVTDLAVSSDKNFLTFNVSESAIEQGNAVVAVKDDEGTIMWSWHLWFTDAGALSTTAFNNADGETQYFTRDNLGLAYNSYEGTSYTSPRRVRVTVTQTGSNQTAQFEIVQNPGTLSVNFRDTKYQFGRKDAFSGLEYYPTNLEYGTKNYQTAIQNPGTFYINSGGGPYYWCSTWNDNAWAVNNTSQANSVSTSSITKSVYDPCPVGFKMPGSNAFTGFATTDLAYTLSEINGTWANKGYTFTDGTNNTSVFFPAAGYLEEDNGEFTYKDQIGYYWSAVPRSNYQGWGLVFTGDETNSSYSAYTQRRRDRASGNSVRPVQSN